MKIKNYFIKKNKLILVALLISSMVTLLGSANAQTVLLSPTGAGGFESGTFAGSGWTVVNGSNNKWYVGTPQVPSAGTYGAYIDKNTAGPYQYTTIAAFTNHFYRDIAFPSGATNIILSFKWKCQGESSFDFLQAFLVPTTTTPVAGTQLASGQLGSNLNLNGGTTYSTATFTLSNALAGTTQRLVFTWVNDGSLGTQPPAAVDEVSVTYAPPCSGTPSGGTTVSSSNGPCSGASFTLSLTGNSSGTGITYQWKSSPTGSGYTNISGATNATLTTSQTSSTYYQCLVTCTSSGFNATSSALQVIMNAYGTCGCGAYAASNATDIADDEILNVTLGTMNNTSVCGALAGGAGSIAYEYSNYTNIIAGPSLTQGLTYSGAVTIGFCNGFAYTTSYAVYIDYNKNGSFADAGELVSNQQGLTAAVAGTAFPFSITIPATALTGITRMRIVDVEGTLIPSPTGTYTWGETEDYCVTIAAGTQCSGSPASSTTIASANPACYNTAFNLSLGSTYTNLGITYQWQSAADVSGIPGTFSNISGATAATYSATQTSTVWYHCLINCSNSGLTTTSSNLKVTTQLCYCIPSYATGCAADRISNFILNTLSNNSGATCVASPAGYSVYGTSPSNQTTTLTPGASYTSTITVVTGNTNGTGVAIWIDYNDNGVFDVSENNNNGATKFASNTTGTLVVNIPVNAPPGQHRMRVRSMRNTNSNAIDPCLAGNATGEAEDYTVTIAAPSASSNPVCEGDTLYLFAIPTGANSYSWSGPNGFSSTLQNPKIAHATAAVAGLYTVNVVIGSSSYSPTATAVFHAKPSVSTTSNSPFCSATQNLNLQTTAPTGVSFSWTGPGGFTSSSQNTSITTPSNSVSGTYKVVVTDGFGCRDSSTKAITIYALPTIGITVIGSANICSGQTTTDLQATGAGVTGAYSWSNTETTSLITVSNAGNFSVTGTDANGCINTQSQVISASTPPAAPVVTPTGTITICFNLSGPIAQTISCTNYSANLLWSTSETTSNISVDYEDIFTLTYTDNAGCFATSNGITTIFDGIAPSITCPADVVSCNTSPALGVPTTSDNCSVATVSNNAPQVFPAGNTDVTWTATDFNNNSSTCVQHVFINSAPIISACPAIISQCDNHAATWTDPTATGTPAASVVCVPASGATFAAGTTSVTCTATNSCGSDACSFTVTINETPVISACPANISQCDNHIATWTDPTATGTPAASVSCSPASGSTFATGTTTVACTATNSCGSSSCSFTVTINEGPVISACPANISQCDNHIATWTDPTATGAPAATVSCSPASGSTFATGTTVVTCTASNNCGNDQCSFTVTINETPVISACPVNIVQCDNHVATWTDPTATGTPAASVVCVPASGSTFSTGATTVTCTATNACGSNACSFNVIINESPVFINVPSDITQCDNHTVTYANPTASGSPFLQISRSVIITQSHMRIQLLPGRQHQQ
ncbi:MAG: GEVED domain-containing protein [Bacteroidetes bacterium]|nr:GEVED domain-containing protein [Bacteroidota bacterium]